MSALTKKQAGFLTAEVLVVTAIVAATVLGSLAVAQKSIYVARQSLHATQAAFLLEEGAENMRIARDNAWSNVANYSASNETIGIFTRAIAVADVYRDGNQDIAVSGTLDTGTKKITVTVAWLEGGNTITRTLSFYLSDIFS